MHCNYRPTTRTDCALDLLNIHLPTMLIGIHEDRPGPHLMYRCSRGDKRVCGNNHFVALCNTKRMQGKMKSGRSRIDSHRITGSTIHCKGSFKFEHWLPFDESR